jgi:hypothetical protein
MQSSAWREKVLHGECKTVCLLELPSFRCCNLRIQYARRRSDFMLERERRQKRESEHYTSERVEHCFASNVRNQWNSDKYV